jgi:TATA-box binding protein (TBP) (component of TFIID and TFIIIB)
MKTKQPTKTPEQKELLRITSGGKVYLEGALVSEEDVKKAWGKVLSHIKDIEI